MTTEPMFCEECHRIERDPIMLDGEICSACGGFLAGMDDTDFDDGQPDEGAALAPPGSDYAALEARLTESRAEAKWLKSRCAEIQPLIARAEAAESRLSAIREALAGILDDDDADVFEKLGDIRRALSGEAGT